VAREVEGQLVEVAAGRLRWCCLATTAAACTRVYDGNEPVSSASDENVRLEPTPGRGQPGSVAGSGGR
jgi:hypothetical protein